MFLPLTKGAFLLIIWVGVLVLPKRQPDLFCMVYAKVLKIPSLKICLKMSWRWMKPLSEVQTKIDTKIKKFLAVRAETEKIRYQFEERLKEVVT